MQGALVHCASRSLLLLPCFSEAQSSHRWSDVNLLLAEVRTSPRVLSCCLMSFSCPRTPSRWLLDMSPPCLLELLMMASMVARLLTGWVSGAPLQVRLGYGFRRGRPHRCQAASSPAVGVHTVLSRVRLWDPMDCSPPGPRDFPGKNSGVGCHFLFQCAHYLKN